MKAIVCELCGSNELIKQDGYFVCQFCGTKYTLEEARKLFVEGTVKIDNTEMIDNYLDLAKNAYDGGNGQSAFDYVNKSLEINPKNSEAWLLKMKVIEKLGTLGDPRVSEAIEAGKNAITFSGDKEKTEEEVYNYYIERATELILLCTAEYLNVTEVKNHKFEFSLISLLSADYNTAQIDLPKLNIYQGVTAEAFKLIDEITTEKLKNRKALDSYKVFMGLVEAEKEALLARVKIYELAVNMDVIKESIPSTEKYLEIYNEANKNYWNEHSEERDSVLNRIKEIENEMNGCSPNEVSKKLAEIDEFDKKINNSKSQLAKTRLKKEKEELTKKYSVFIDRLEEIKKLEKEIEELKNQLA